MELDRKTKLLVISLVFLVVMQAVWLIFLSNRDNFLQEKEVNNAIVHNTPSSSRDSYEEIPLTSNECQKDSERIYGGIIPHHLLVKDFITEFFQGLPGECYETVVIIGPNHFDAGNKNILFSAADWETPFGRASVDNKLVEAAKKYNFISEEEPFAREHSISSIVPFIKQRFPQAKIIPFIIKSGSSGEEAETLAKFLVANVNLEKTLVLASVDFSHYQTTLTADFHDLKSINAIESFDFKETIKSEVDSPLSLLVLESYLEKMGAKQAELVRSTNSGRLTKQEDAPTTSHNFFYFKKGSETKKSSSNFLFFGDLMIDRSVGDRLAGKKIGYLLDGLAGEEKRFFSGIDIIGANLEGAVTNNGEHYAPTYSYDFAFSPGRIAELKDYGFNYFTSANNHFSDQGQKGVSETRKNLDDLKIYHSGAPDAQIDEYSREDIEIAEDKVALIGLSMVYNDFDLGAAQKLVENAKLDSDLVIINIHWGTEYEHQFNKHQQLIGRALIDSGADVIIGHHPHVVQGMEIYKGKPIFYSLGNLVFDQYFSTDTQEGLGVGLDFSNNRTNIFLFPLQSAKSVPNLMTKDLKFKFLDKFISWSQLGTEAKEQIKNQRMEILR